METRSFLILITLLGIVWPTSRLNGQVTVSCDLQEDFIVLGCFGGLDCVPALTNPAIVKASKASYLLSFWEQPEIADIESLITSVDSPDDDFAPPRDFSLLQNFPNPFNPSTKITYELTEPGVVTLKIYDLLGREVRTLLNNEKQSSGRKSVAWDGTNDLGERVASGVYLYQLQSGMFKQTRKMILIR